MPIPSLPNLPADLHWLIQMEPTRETLDAYIAGQPPAWALPGAHTKRFIISNIFGRWPTDDNNLGYELVGVLAGKRDKGLLDGTIETMPFDEDVETANYLLRNCDAGAYPQLPDQKALSAVLWAEKFTAHCEQVDKLCRTLRLHLRMGSLEVDFGQFERRLTG